MMRGGAHNRHCTVLEDPVPERSTCVRTPALFEATYIDCTLHCVKLERVQSEAYLHASGLTIAFLYEKILKGDLHGHAGWDGNHVNTVREVSIIVWISGTFKCVCYFTTNCKRQIYNKFEARSLYINEYSLRTRTEFRLFFHVAVISCGVKLKTENLSVFAGYNECKYSRISISRAP